MSHDHMDVEQYLASPQALEDVVEHFARPHDEHKITTCGWYGRNNTWSSHPVANWPVDQNERDDRSPWGAIRFGSMKVYFRHDGCRHCPNYLNHCPKCHRRGERRYIVTDLGEAVRALRLRTGCRASEASSAAVALALPDEVAGLALGMAEGAIEVRHQAPGDIWRSGVAAADLPRAICGVMLAAYRVSRLEVQRG